MPLSTDPNTLPMWTPGAIADYAREIGRAVRSLHRDILEAREELDHGFLDAWQEFGFGYLAFLDELGAIDMGVGATADRLEQYAAQYNGFEEAYIQATGRQPSLPAPRAEGGFPWGWLFFAVAIGVGGYLVYRYIARAAPARRSKRRALAGARQVSDLGSSGTTYYLEV